MKHLTLIRHAKSDWSDPDLSDFDRPLNGRGKKAAPKMGKRLAMRGDIPDIFISSPAKRARKTTRLIARELEISKAEIFYQAEIFEAEAKALIRLLSQLAEHTHVALVGHNPGLTELAEWLCPDSPVWLPTCAVLTLALEIDSWEDINKGCSHILNYDFPKKAV